MNQGVNQVTLLKKIKKAMKRHPVAFNSFGVSREEIVTRIVDDK